MVWTTLETPQRGEKPAFGDESPKNFWTVEEARAAGKVSERCCIHGLPLNVFCGKCED